MIIPRNKKNRRLKVMLISLGIIVLLCVFILVLMPFVMMRDLVNLHVDFQKTYDAADYGLTAKRLTLTTEDGLKLVAYQVDAEDPRAAVVFVSGIQSPSVTAFFGHAAMLKKAGYSSILVEMRAHGESEGDLICLGTKEYMDVQAAVRYIKERSPELPVVVFGLSMGAGTVVNAIGETKGIDALVSLSAFSTWPDLFADNMTLMGLPRFVCEMEKPFVWLYMGVQFGFDRLQVNPLTEIGKLNGRPALLMHSRDDTQVPFASFERLTAAAPEVETYVVDGDRHFICEEHFLNPEQDAAYAGAILTFLNNHFTPADA
jgi:alpha-beta hydrolase superfamily lysophospholipase